MEVSDIEAVLEFLRKNGLSHSESALMDDILEKSHPGSFDFQKFLFPIASPPLPPLKIPAARPPPPPPPPPPPRLTEEDPVCSDDSSDEFVSLGSSTTELCSSDFTNPYGINTLNGASSHGSSDRLSQFGTARDYHDFDLQNDGKWYRERDEDYDMPPCFDNSDPLGGPSEDKFVMTLEKEGNANDNDQLDFDPLLDPLEKTNFLDKPWPFTSIGYLKDGEKITDYYYHLDEDCVEERVHSATFYSSFKEIDLNDFHGSDMGHKSDDCFACLENNKGSDYDDLVRESKNTNDVQTQLVKKDDDFNVNDDYDDSYDREVQEFREQDASRAEEGDAIATNDELLMYTNEEEYEVFDLRIIHRKNRTGFEEQKDLPIVLNSVIGARYCVTEYLGSAAFSKVVQAHDLQMGVDVCLKIIKNDKDFFDQSLDEIKLLKYVNKHDPADERHILRLYDYFYFQEHLIIVCELLRANLYEFQKYNRESGGEPYFTLSRLQVITRQCLEALEYLHELGVIHCDLKPENILIKSYSRCEIKVIDLGSSCFQNDNLSLYVQSRSYRAPEVIIGLPYDQKIDLWSLGCILAELSSGDVLFPNDALVFLLARVIGMLGPIDFEMLERGQETEKYFTKDFDLYHINEDNELEYIIPHEASLKEHLQVSDTLFIDFVRTLLEINPQRRPLAREALQHPWLSVSYDT